MSADRIHLVRHGEVHNPDRVLYERLPGFGLSEDGRRMTRDAAAHIKGLERPVSRLLCSPLQRTQESSEPFTELFGLEPELDGMNVREALGEHAGEHEQRRGERDLHGREHSAKPCRAARPDGVKGSPFDDGSGVGACRVQGRCNAERHERHERCAGGDERCGGPELEARAAGERRG